MTSAEEWLGQGAYRPFSNLQPRLLEVAESGVQDPQGGDREEPSGSSEEGAQRRRGRDQGACTAAQFSPNTPSPKEWLCPGRKSMATGGELLSLPNRSETGTQRDIASQSGEVGADEGHRREPGSPRARRGGVRAWQSGRPRRARAGPEARETRPGAEGAGRRTGRGWTDGSEGKAEGISASSHSSRRAPPRSAPGSPPLSGRTAR